jgi:hypothetical protein
MDRRVEQDEPPTRRMETGMSQQARTPALSPDAVRDELQFLLSLEHALLIEYLTIYCALGVDLPFEEGGPSDDGSPVASAAFNLALFQMGRLARFTPVAGVPDAGNIDRATSIPGPDGATISLEPLGIEQLRDVLGTAEAIARATDARYAALEPHVQGPAFDEDVRTAVQGGQGHLSRVQDNLRDALGALHPADLLRATRREGTTANENALLDASDLVYNLLLEQFTNQHRAPDDETSTTFRFMARRSMDLMKATHLALAHLGLLPPFTLSFF